jgi:hypothetical protein
MEIESVLEEEEGSLTVPSEMSNVSCQRAMFINIIHMYENKFT